MTEQILLVEDNPRDIDIALDVLKKSGYALEVVVVHDGEQALDYLNVRGEFRLRRPGLPALILLDVKMPKVDGFEVLRHLRGNSAMTAIPVLMLSSSRQEQDLLSAYDLKADGYLIKPLNQQQLDAAMTTARASAAARSARG
jgi:CheY-like chemotaxis protein